MVSMISFTGHGTCKHRFATICIVIPTLFLYSVDFTVVYFSMLCLILESVDEKFAILAIVRPIKLFRYYNNIIMICLFEVHTLYAQ